MSNITIESTTDSKEAVTAALGNLASSEVVEEKSASENTSDETAKDSESLEQPEDLKAKTDDESEGEETESKNEELEKPKKKGGYQKRIDRLVRERTELASELEFLRRERAERAQPKEEAVAVKLIDGKPKEEDFETHAAYVDALTDWKLDQREIKKRDDAFKAEFQNQAAKFAEKASTFKESHEDYDDVMEDVSDIPISMTVRDLLYSSELGPELAYELAKDREELARICKLAPVAAARELGRFEAKITRAESSKPTIKKTTKAPPPIKPVGTSASGVSSKSPDEMSFTEYKVWRAANPHA